ncbi:hypothetical protein ACI2KR_06975 [Pseudomonas luteola]
MHTPFHLIENAISALEEAGMREISLSLIEATESLRQSMLSYEEQKCTEQMVHEYLINQNTKLSLDILDVIKNSSVAGLKSLYPSLEENAAVTASQQIHKRGIDTAAFKLNQKQVVDDANDEAILLLMDF